MKRNTRQLISLIVVFALIAAAYSCRMLAKFDIGGVYVNYIRAALYLLLFSLLGYSLDRRIIQPQTLHCLRLTAALMLVWLVLRTLKYEIVTDPTVARYIWYLYYLPMLFIPILALLVALSLGKPDDYRLPKATCALWIISGVLLLLVLTNDLHQFVFTFPEDAGEWSDKSNGYGIGSFIVIGWQIFCMISALVVMIIKCRLKNGRRQLWTVIPMVVSLVYLGLNYMDVQWFKLFFGDVTAFQSLMYMLCFEGCITCGFIHSNSRYFDLFSSSIGTSAVITDKDFNVRYAALNARRIPRIDMMKAEHSPLTIENGLTVHSIPVNGGYAVWTEDMSALLAVKEESESLAEELNERNNLLRYEYKREAKRQKIEEQNRLYDLLRSATQTQINKISVLTKEYQKINKTDPARAKTLLAEIAVLCSYIKRRKHLTLLTDRDYKVAITELTRAFTESLQTLKLLNVRSTFYADSELSMIPGKSAAAIFDFYEQVIESDLENISGIQVSLADVEGLRLSINICCKADLSFFACKDNVRYETDDDEEYQQLVFLLEGGAAV